MHKWRILVGLFSSVLVLCLATSSRAVTASPHLHELTQPDGKIFEARQWGDEWLHGWETRNGYTIIRDQATGYWYYAGRASTGALAATSMRADTDAPAGLPKSLRPSRQYLREHSLLADSDTMRSVSAQGTPTSGTVSVAVLLVNFPDTSTSHTPAQFESLLFGTSSTIATGPGSLTNYYEEVSYGRLALISGPSGIGGWYTASQVHDYYGANGPDGSDLHAAELVREAVNAAIEAQFDFSRYDANGDGEVDALVVVHQGTDEAESPDSNDIWSHRGWLSQSGGAISTGGVSINSYIIVPERHHIPLWFDTMATIGTYAHEFGHLLGLPDLYDTDHSSSGSVNLIWPTVML